MLPALLRWLTPVAVRAPRSLVLSLIFVGFADEWFTYFPAGALEAIRADLSLSYREMGLVLAALGSGGLVGNGFTLAADYVDRRILAAGGAFAYALCLAAFGLAGNFWVAAAICLVWGAASDAFISGCEIALVDAARDDLAPALARVNALGAVGDVLGPLTIAAGAYAGLSWRVLFLLAALLMALYALVLALQRFPAHSTDGDEEEQPTPFRSVLSVITDRRILAFALVDLLFSVLDEPFWGFWVAYLDRVHGVGPSAASAVVTVGVAGGVVGYVAVPWCSRRWQTRPILFVSTLLLGVATLGTVFAPTLLLRAPSAALFGVAGAVLYSVQRAAYLGLRPGQAGATSAVVSWLGNAAVLYPIIVGATSDRLGLTAGMLLYAAVPAAILLALVLAVGLPGGTRNAT